MASVRYPALAKQTARLSATVVLPHPPFALVMVKTYAMVANLSQIEFVRKADVKNMQKTSHHTPLAQWCKCQRASEPPASFFCHGWSLGLVGKVERDV